MIQLLREPERVCSGSSFYALIAGKPCGLFGGVRIPSQALLPR
jgi:hypothetical protein